MPKVSIIIAMYNIEEYIAYCINSCVNQIDVDPEDYEIIIVNDGATDRSLDVALDAIKGVSNARIITRQNGGLSAARNTGIENAKGKYLWFVDGDDAERKDDYGALRGGQDEGRWRGRGSDTR